MEGLVRRERYLGKLESGRGLKDVVKVVTGMRRAGKTTLLKMYMDDLRNDGVRDDNIVYINFESFEYQDIADSKQLNPILMDLIGDSGERYVFLDEIQNVEGWERSVSALTLTERCDVYITGSNSRMLSSELATHISGRYIEVPVLPLSFSEYLGMHPGDRTARFAEYLRFGGLPEVDPARGEELCDSQLDGVFNTVVVKDIMGRLKRGDARALTAIARFLYSNVGNETNVDLIAERLHMGNDTVKKYVTMLTDAFLFYEAERYDIVGKRLLSTNGKFYASDLGVRHAALRGAGGADISRPLENVVFLELVRRGYEVRIGSYRDREVDFTATRDGRTEYYQVCQSMLSEDTRERELRSLSAIRDNFPKVVLTLDTLGLGSHESIEIRNVLDWLLSERGVRSRSGNRFIHHLR